MAELCHSQRRRLHRIHSRIHRQLPHGEQRQLPKHAGHPAGSSSRNCIPPSRTPIHPAILRKLCQGNTSGIRTTHTTIRTCPFSRTTTIHANSGDAIPTIPTGRARNSESGREGTQHSQPTQPERQYFTPTTPATTCNIPSSTLGVPPPAFQPPSTPPNPVKYYNNWNMCFSCGFDVEGWHTSATCRNKKHGHQDGCTRENAQAYKDAGHKVTWRGAHKTTLPVNPGPRQA